MQTPAANLAALQQQQQQKNFIANQFVPLNEFYNATAQTQMSNYAKLKFKSEKLFDIRNQQQQSAVGVGANAMLQNMPMINVENVNFYGSLDEQQHKSVFLHHQLQEASKNSNCTNCLSHPGFHHHHHQAQMQNCNQATAAAAAAASVAMNLAKLFTNANPNSKNLNIDAKSMYPMYHQGLQNPNENPAMEIKKESHARSSHVDGISNSSSSKKPSEFFSENNSKAKANKQKIKQEPGVNGSSAKANVPTKKLNEPPSAIGKQKQKENNETESVVSLSSSSSSSIKSVHSSQEEHKSQADIMKNNKPVSLSCSCSIKLEPETMTITINTKNNKNNENKCACKCWIFFCFF